MRQLHILSLTLSILFLVGLTSSLLSAQIVLEATYPTTNLQRLNLPVSGEKWYYADDIQQKIFFFNADHTAWKTINYPKETNRKTSLATINMPVSQDVFKVDALLEFVWVFTDSLTRREQIKILNERGEIVFAFEEGRNKLTVNELEGSSAKLFVQKEVSSRAFTTTIYSLPNIVKDTVFDNAYNLNRLKFKYAGEKFYFRNLKAKRVEIYHTSYSFWKSISLPMPTNSDTTIPYDSHFIVDDGIIDSNVVECIFSYDMRGFTQHKLVNDTGKTFIRVNSNSSFKLEVDKNLSNKLIVCDFSNSNAPSAPCKIINLTNLFNTEKTYRLLNSRYSRLERKLFKYFGYKFQTTEYGRINLYHSNHNFWKTLNLNSTSINHLFAADEVEYPFVSDNLVNPDSLIEVIWSEWHQTTFAFQLRITNERGQNIATIPNARTFSVNQMGNLTPKLITKTWDNTHYTTTQVWHFNPTTVTNTPSVKSDLDVQLSPNPFTTTLNINISNADTPLSIQLYNTMGVSVFSQKINSTFTILNLPYELPKGIYFAEIRIGKERIIRKIVKI